jgi:hypothetical protein
VDTHWDGIVKLELSGKPINESQVDVKLMDGDTQMPHCQNQSLFEKTVVNQAAEILGQDLSCMSLGEAV